jgi:hypothetical protein
MLCPLARQGRIAPRGLEVTHDIRIPQRVAEAGCVRQQISQRDRIVRRPQLRSTLRIESLEDLRCGERRIDIGRRLVQFQFAALHQLQCGYRGQQLDHRGNAEDRI